MIINFLYKMDEKNKRIITGMVVNDELIDYDSERVYDLILEDDVKLNEGERIVSNYGRQYYGAIFDNDNLKCVNVNDYMLTVKLSLTDNLNYVTYSSKEMLDEIINETANFNEANDMEYIDAGYMLTRDASFKDGFEMMFKKANDNVYVQLNYMKKPMFIGKENNEYILTDDFAKAFRVERKAIRPLLLIRGYVDKDVDRKELAFSKYNCFYDGASYIFGGENSFKVSLSENEFGITFDPVIDTTYRLVNDETRFNHLRKICYLLKEDKEKSGRLFSIENRYLKEIAPLYYTFVDNASIASVIDYKDIDILKQAYILFTENTVFKTEKKSDYYCYYTDELTYNISNEKKEYKSKAISKEAYDLFIDSFKNKSSIKDGVVVISNNHYVEIELLDTTTFKIKFHSSGLNATVFSIPQAEALEQIVDFEVKKKEMIALHDVMATHNIKKSEDIKNINSSYDKVLLDINSSSIRLNPFPKLDEIKFSSDKGALEYLKALYPKCLMDSYMLFKRMLKHDIKNILIVGASSNADLQGLAYASQELNINVNVTQLETTKWGFYTECLLPNTVSYDGAYRIPFTSLPKEFINKFDCVYFGKCFNEPSTDVKKMLEDLKHNNKSLYIVNTSICNLGKFPCPLTEIFSDKLTRKHFKLTTNSYGLKNVDMDEMSFENPIISNNVSFSSMIKVGENRFIDLLKK